MEVKTIVDLGADSSDSDIPEEQTMYVSTQINFEPCLQHLSFLPGVHEGVTCVLSEQHVCRDKELLKKKRRKRQELFQQQKKRKLLSEDNLEEIESAYIKLKESFKAVRLKDQTDASTRQESASDFIRSRLYGPGTNRTTTNKMLSLKNKTGNNKTAAVQFVNKNWDS
ncbi:nucleolar protein 7-like [Polyodon spathula]|uniref:nucleolar protein 7-like n=1 Tax=Polyodon spathula TaxID=7913 RepID=UPI001B7EAD8D|nr:nucleolar protein 7-like [Polyodon spathula]